jgi:hypothetical protein
MVGGGVALEGTRSPISANFGFQKVLIDGGDVLFGFNVMFALK